MLKGYITIAFIFALIRLSFSNNNICDYICDNGGCKIPTKNSDSSISSIKFCNSNDIPNDVNFSIIEYENETSEFPVFLQITFKPPKKECKYGITLLANDGINERKCMYHNFQNLRGIETHTRATICFLSTDNEYQNTTEIYFPYIFTACYSVQFFCGKSVKMIKDNKFLRTNYKHTEVVKPAFECTYEIVPDIISNKRQVDFEVSISVSIVTAVMIYLGSLYSTDGQDVCFINKQDLRNGIQQLNVLDNYIENIYHNSNMPLFKNGKYTRDWKFQIDISYKENYCFVISLYHDIRCKENTLWKPSTKRCTWYQSCQNVTLYDHIGFKANTDVDTISNLYLPITIITLTLFAIVGFMYLIYVIHTCNLQTNKFYINICNGNVIKTNQVKSNRRDSLNKNKMKNKNNDTNIINTDVILLYPKGPESFMTYMADFRGIISRVCGCVVHDWYDGTEWNYVAEIGASDWFAQMLHKESRVIWIDTPTMRSLITQRFKNNSAIKTSEEYNFVKIGDFRDVVFPTVFNLSKRNMEQSELHQSKHFIVRLKGFEHVDNDNDPFVDLCPHKLYCIPQDLNLLCSDLSVLDSDMITLLTRQEEELMKKDLHNVKFEFCK